jgi:hypothetical protein
MTLYAIIEKLKMLALKHPNVNSAYEGNIYDIMNANPEQKYASVVLTQQSHTQDDTYDHYGFNLFYVDRLVDDLDSNRVQIQSTGKSMLSNIIKAFCEEFDAECETINYQTFTERFADECAGVYCTITIDMVKDIYCTEKYWDESWSSPLITVRNQNKSVEFTANGTYTIEYDAANYTGLGKVSVEVNVPDLNGSYDEGYTEGKNDGIQEGYADGKQDGYTEGFDVGKNQGLEEGYVDGKADGIEEGYSQGKSDGFNEGKVEGYTEGKEDGISEQKAKLEGITITANGTYTKEDGYDSVEVALPIQTDKVADIRLNGSYVIEPDDNYVALDKLVLNVEAKTKTAIPNGLSFAESTFTEFPLENYDWKAVRDTTYMFGNCPNLNTTPIIDALNDGTIPTRCTSYMFYGDSVKKLEGIDFTKFDYYEGMFMDVTDLEEVRNCVIPPLKNKHLISCTNKLCKVIDCDFSKISGKSLNINNYYFCNFKSVGGLTELSTNGDRFPVHVMECDKPSTLSIPSSTTIWYDASKYTGWEGRTYSYPYGFWYNVISKNPVDIKIKQVESETRFNFEQVIPYNEEKGCHYIDYPYYMSFNVYINGVIIDSLTGKYNVDVYCPYNEVGVYEGLDIKYLFYYYFNNEGFTLNENGLCVLIKNSYAYQRIYTPTDAIKITVFNEGGSLVDKVITEKNGVSTNHEIKKNSETEVIIDTYDCEYINMGLYIRNPDKAHIKSIEIL